MTGSVKFDGLEADRDNPRTLELRRALGLTSADSSSSPAARWRARRPPPWPPIARRGGRIPRLRLVLVPRHAERFDEVAAWLEAEGERVVRRSRSDGVAGRAGEPPPVILLDTIGELGAAWGLADVAFVGGSLFPGRGGQNMMEPAAYGASVLFGPHTANFRETVEQLLARDGARRVADAADAGPRPCSKTSTTPRPPRPGARRAGRSCWRRTARVGRTFAEIDRLVEAWLAGAAA